VSVSAVPPHRLLRGPYSGVTGLAIGRPRGSTGPVGRSRAAALHESAAPRKGEEGEPNRWGSTIALLAALRKSATP
jgi:hypothetical protein